MKISENKKRGIIFIILIFLLIGIFYCLASNKIFFSAILSLLFFILLILNIKFIKEIFSQILEELGKNLKKYSIELIIFSIIAGLLLIMISINFTPVKYVDVKCGQGSNPLFQINIDNPNKEEVEDFTLLIHDAWINNFSLSERWGWFAPRYYGVRFYGPSKWLCNATNIEYDEPYVENGCNIIDCPYKYPDNYVPNRAIRISCNYIPPNTKLNIEVNVWDVGMKKINYFYEGFLDISYYSKNQKFNSKFIGCGKYPQIMVYYDDYRYDTNKPDYFIFFPNRNGFYLTDAIPYLILGIIIIGGVLIVFIILRKGRKKRK